MIVHISDETVQEIAGETGGKTPEAVGKQLEDLWNALENPAQVVERYRKERQVANR